MFGSTKFIYNIKEYHHSWRITYLFTAWSRVLHEKLTGSQLVKKLSVFYGPEGSLSHWQAPAPCPCHGPDHSISRSSSLFLKNHLNIILLSTPGFSKWSLPLRFPRQNPVYTSPLPHTCRMPLPSHSFRFYNSNDIGWGVHHEAINEVIHYIIFRFINNNISDI